MSPVIGVIVIFWILRAIGSSGGSTSGGGKYGNPASKQMGGTSSPQMGGTQIVNNSTEISPAVLAVILKALAIPFALAVAGDFSNQFVVYVLDVVAAPIFLPTLFLRRILVPLGWHRVAYWWFRCTWPFGFGKEFRMGAVYYGTLALARSAASAEDIQWLRRRLPDANAHSIAYDTVLALFAAMAGERDTARTILHAIDVTRGPRSMRCVARNWLVADSISRRDWSEVIRRGRRGRDSFRWSYALARMVERVDRRAAAAPDWLLCLLWLLAPQRRRVLPFLRAALAVPRAPRSAPTAWPVPADLPSALADLAGMLQNMSKTGQQPEPAHFLAIVQGAHTQLESPQTQIRVQERLKTLDPLRNDAADAVDTIVRSMQQQLLAMLIPIVDQHPRLIAGQTDQPLVKEAMDRIQQSALQDIELRCRDYEQRTSSETSMGPQAEWSTWASLQKRANHVLNLDKGAADSLFQTMYGPVCNFAVFQHNVLKHHRLAHDMFSWLRHYAQSNQEASALLDRNIAAYSLRWNQGK